MRDLQNEFSQLRNNESDYNLEWLQKHKELMYQKFSEGLTGMMAGVNLDNAFIFDAGKEKYLKIIKKMEDMGLCYSKKHQQETRKKLSVAQSMLTGLKNKKIELETTLQNVTTQLSNQLNETIRDIAKYEAQINDLEEKLSA